MPALSCRSTMHGFPQCTSGWYRQARPTITAAGPSICIEALNHALRGIPEHLTRYHICWGSWNGPHTADLPLKEFVDLLLRINVGGYSVEGANPRHEHEWRVWEEVKLPGGPQTHPRGD